MWFYGAAVVVGVPDLDKRRAPSPTHSNWLESRHVAPNKLIQSRLELSVKKIRRDCLITQGLLCGKMWF